MEEKSLQLERTVFFCDAVVAIAITLLAFNLKIDHATDGHLHFSDIFRQWKTFAAFGLSFLNIANFWRTHHIFYCYIKKMDEKLLWYNIFWLFFIILLPFTTSLVSTYFSDTPSIFAYSVNTLFIAIFQNNIWDYSSTKPDFLKPGSLEQPGASYLRLFCNLEMINALLAIGVSFWRPGFAFILLFTKLPMLLLSRFFIKPEDRKKFARRKGGRGEQ